MGLCLIRRRAWLSKIGLGKWGLLILGACLPINNLAFEKVHISIPSGKKSNWLG